MLILRPCDTPWASSNNRKQHCQIFKKARVYLRTEFKPTITRLSTKEKAHAKFSLGLVLKRVLYCTVQLSPGFFWRDDATTSLALPTTIASQPCSILYIWSSGRGTHMSTPSRVRIPGPPCHEQQRVEASSASKTPSEKAVPKQSSTAMTKPATAVVTCFCSRTPKEDLPIPVPAVRGTVQYLGTVQYCTLRSSLPSAGGVTGSSPRRLP